LRGPASVLDREEEELDCDAAMLRGEGTKPAGRLLELPLAADAVSAACLIPRDRDVDEALEEVLLLGIGRAPDVLERLVRLEVLAARDLRESAAHVLVHEVKCYARSKMATILLAGVDLFFRGKLEAALVGHRFITTEGVDPPDLVIADIARIDPDEVAEAYPEVPILGFSNHSDTSGLRRAHEAGFDQVVAKSALSERANELVDGLIA
jgi:hypothetical protein